MSAESSSQEPPLIKPVFCSQCRAANPSHAQQCWLCNASLTNQVAASNPYAVREATHASVPVHTAVPGPLPSPAQGRIEQVFLCLLVAIVLLVLLVAIGLGAQDTGLLTLFLMIVVPALAAASVSGLYSVAKGESPKPSRMFMTLIYSAFMTIGLGALLIVGSVIFFLMMCAQMLGGFGHP